MDDLGELFINSYLYLESMFNFMTGKLKSAEPASQGRQKVVTKISPLSLNIVSGLGIQMTGKLPVQVSGYCYPINSRHSQHSLMQPYYANISNTIWHLLPMNWLKDPRSNLKLAQTVHSLCRSVEKWTASLLKNTQQLPMPEENSFELRKRACRDLQILIDLEQASMRGRLFASNSIVLVQDAFSVYKAAVAFPVCFESPASKSFHQLSVSESIMLDVERMALYEKVRDGEHENLMVPFKEKLLNLLKITNVWLLNANDSPQFALSVMTKPEKIIDLIDERIDV